MEKCNSNSLDLTRYLQNKMARDEESEFQKHLSNCSVCKDKLERLRAAIREIEQEEGSKKGWIIAVAIACSVAGGIYFLPRNQLQEKQPFEFNHPQPYDEIDSTLINDTLFLDTIPARIKILSIE